MKLVRAAKDGYIFSSAAHILIGVAFFIWPQLSAIFVCRIVGAVILLAGVAKMFGYFSNDLYRLAFQFDLALGALTMLLGVLMLSMPRRFIKIIVAAAAIYVFVNAIFTVQTAFDARSFGLSKWWILLISAVLSGVIGVLAFVYPQQGAAAIAWLVGAVFIADGIQNLLVASLTIRIRKDVQSENGGRR